jgi:hypothetical protein
MLTIRRCKKTDADGIGLQKRLFELKYMIIFKAGFKTDQTKKKNWKNKDG